MLMVKKTDYPDTSDIEDLDESHYVEVDALDEPTHHGLQRKASKQGWN